MRKIYIFDWSDNEENNKTMMKEINIKIIFPYYKKLIII